MNYPDNFNIDAFEERYASPEDVCPDAIKELNDVHGVYADVLAALVASCKKHRVCLSLSNVQEAMEGVGEALADCADSPLNRLYEAGYNDFSYTPENSKKLVARASEDIYDAFRIKQIPVSKFLADSYRQAEAETAAENLRASRSHILTNPATYIANGVAI